MKPNVIVVHKGECLIEVIANLGKRVKNSWIFLHSNTYEELPKFFSTNLWCFFKNCTTFKDSKSNEYPDATIKCSYNYLSVWMKVVKISIGDAEYEKPVFNPSEIFYIQMEED